MLKKILIPILILIMLSASGKDLKIISLSPNLTEILFQLKQGHNLIGRSTACKYPGNVSEIPVAGNMGDPNLEKIISMKPDIIILTNPRDSSKIRILQNLGFKVYIMPTNSIEQYMETVNSLGKLLNAEEESGKEITRIKNGIDKLEKENRTNCNGNKPEVFWEIWDNPIITAGKNSFINEYITLAGGKNITGNINKPYFYISKENIISSKPDVIIAPYMKGRKAKELETAIGWKSVPAVKNKRIYSNLDPDLIYILGPRIFEAISAIHKCLYPDEKTALKNH